MTSHLEHKSLRDALSHPFGGDFEYQSFSISPPRSTTQNSHSKHSTLNNEGIRLENFKMCSPKDSQFVPHLVLSQIDRFFMRHGLLSEKQLWVELDPFDSSAHVERLTKKIISDQHKPAAVITVAFSKDFFTVTQELENISRLDKKKFLVDTAASLSFALPIGVTLDLVFTGLTFHQMLSNRATFAVINLLTGGLYGKYRDAIYHWFGGDNPSQARKFCLDVGANTSFSLPLYAITTKIFGASWQGVLQGMFGVIISCAALSRLYGGYQDMFRKWFGVNPAGDD